MISTDQSHDQPGISFDAQAWIFDHRASLPRVAARRIARIIRELASLQAGDLLVEIGAGTGEVGADLAAEEGLRYLGFDLSLPMLTVFRGKLESGRGALVRADGNLRWPIADGRARAVFLSRSAHLLREEHLAEEALRVSDRRGACLFLGSVRREQQSVHHRMRRKMHQLLAERGVKARSSERTRRRLAAAFEQRGGEPLPPRTAASWHVTEKPGDSLVSWRDVAGLAGRVVDPAAKTDFLCQLELWARDEWGDLDVAREATERYELAMIGLHGRGKLT